MQVAQRLNRRRGHRDRAFANPRDRAHLFRGGEGALEQRIERAPHRSRQLRFAVGFFDLPQNLTFADHRALQGAGDAEEAAHGVPLASAAMQFPLAHPQVASLIIGAVTPQEVERNVETLSVDIPQGLWDDLKAQGLIRPDAPVPTG